MIVIEKKTEALPGSSGTDGGAVEKVTEAISATEIPGSFDEVTATVTETMLSLPKHKKEEKR